MSATCFVTPKSLPSNRDTDNAINMQVGIELVSVRPYKYPYIKKNKIKQLVQEMLVSEIIRPSSSPFSSPMLLVKRKIVPVDSVLIITPEQSYNP